MELKAYQWGQFGVPLIFSAGDDKLQEDLKTAPWIEYVVVKRATSASSAELIPLDQVHAEMREKAKRAVQNLARAKVMQMTVPVRITVRAVPPASLEDLAGFPGVHYANQAVTFTAPALTPEGFNQMVAAVNLASSAGQSRRLRQTLEGTPQGRELLRSVGEKYWNRWLDHESGRGKPAETTRH